MKSQHVKTEEKKPKAPDGGWGWFVCLGFSLILVTLKSLDSCFGLIFKDLLLDLKTSSTTASVIVSCNDAFYNFSGIFAAPLIGKFSCRTVVFFGTILGSAGLFFTAFAYSIPHIIVTYSIMLGVGTGLAIPSAFIILTMYFDKKRGIAHGVSTSGSSLAQMLIPQAANILLGLYGFNGTMLVLSALSMHSIVGACLLRPLEIKEKKQHQNVMAIRVIELENSTVKIDGKSSLDTEPDKANNNSRSTAFFKVFIDLFQVNLLKNYAVLNTILGLAIFNIAEVNFKLMLPFFLRTTVGMDEDGIALGLSIISFTDIISRIVISIISDKFRIKKRRIFWISSLCIAIIRSTMAEQTERIPLLICLLIYGFFRGAAYQNVLLSLSDTCSLENLPSAIGLFMVTRGIFILIFNPLVGYLRDYSESYKLTFHATNVLIVIGFISWGIEFSWQAIRNKKQKSLQSTL